MSPNLIDNVLKRVCVVGKNDLPHRQFTLHFDLPVALTGKSNPPEQRLRDLQAELRVHENTPLSQLEFAIEQLSYLANFKLSVRKRFSILELIGFETADLVRRVYIQYRDEQDISAGEARKRNLDRILEVVRLLIAGYLRIFQSLAELPDTVTEGSVNVCAK